MTLFRSLFGGSSEASQRIGGREAWRLVREEGAVLLDVRSPAEYASGHADGALNIPLQDLSRRLGEVPEDRPVVVYCASGRRSASACEALSRAGRTAYDAGGLGALAR